MPAPSWDESSLTGLPVLQLHPTLRCNLTCAHCYSSSGPSADQELAVEDLLRLLDDAWALGYRQLSVSGGEPLLYAGLPYLLAHARWLGMVTSLVTNGLLLRTRRWEAVRPLTDAVAVSVDGDEQEHDLIRGRRGAFARTVEGLRALRASGTAYALTTTLTQYNAAGLESVVRLAAEHGAVAVQVHPLSTMGRAADTMDGHRPDALELLASLTEAEWLGRRLGVPVHLDAVTRDQLVGFRDSFVQPPDAPLSRAAGTLVVAADASVRPLTWDIDPALHLGSLYDADLADLAHAWRDSTGPARLRQATATAWQALVDREDTPISYWYDAVAAASRDDDADHTDQAAGRISAPATPSSSTTGPATERRS